MHKAGGEFAVAWLCQQLGGDQRWLTADVMQRNKGATHRVFQNPFSKCEF
jgi:hypothetical protein